MELGHVQLGVQFSQLGYGGTTVDWKPYLACVLYQPSIGMAACKPAPEMGIVEPTSQGAATTDARIGMSTAEKEPGLAATE